MTFFLNCFHTEMALKQLKVKITFEDYIPEPEVQLHEQNLMSDLINTEINIAAVQVILAKKKKRNPNQLRALK